MPKVAQMMLGQKPWQCCERFTRQIDPRIDRKSGWTWEEDVTLVKAERLDQHSQEIFSLQDRGHANETIQNSAQVEGATAMGQTDINMEQSSTEQQSGTEQKHEQTRTEQREQN